jgi:hypothetical protein
MISAARSRRCVRAGNFYLALPEKWLLGHPGATFWGRKAAEGRKPGCGKEKAKDDEAGGDECHRETAHPAAGGSEQVIGIGGPMKDCTLIPQRPPRAAWVAFGFVKRSFDELRRMPVFVAIRYYDCGITPGGLRFVRIRFRNDKT